MSSITIMVLLIGGRSGVGKTTVSHEVSDLLRERDVAHALVDGDNLDAVYPKPDQVDITWQNLAAIWRNYRTFGQERLIYVNTVSVLQGGQHPSGSGRRSGAHRRAADRHGRNCR